MLSFRLFISCMTYLALSKLVHIRNTIGYTVLRNIPPLYTWFSTGAVLGEQMNENIMRDMKLILY